MNKKTVQQLSDYRNQILQCVESIQNILQQNKECEKEYYLANSHYIPQIVTALMEVDKWLPRGNYTLQNTIDNLNDKIESSQNKQKGVTKYIV
jgi:hypothetical protein